MSAPEGRELGPYDTFQERIRWFYRNAPECLEARKHSFRRQFDVAFVLAMQEAIRAATPPAPEVTEDTRDFDLAAADAVMGCLALRQADALDRPTQILMADALNECIQRMRVALAALRATRSAP